MHGSTGGTALERPTGEVTRCGNPHASLAAPVAAGFFQESLLCLHSVMVAIYAFLFDGFAFRQMHMFQ